MSSNSNVVKNKKLDVIEILDNSKKARILFLIALGISALGIRFYFSHTMCRSLMMRKDIFGMPLI